MYIYIYLFVSLSLYIYIYDCTQTNLPPHARVLEKEFIQQVFLKLWNHMFDPYKCTFFALDDGGIF